MSTNNELKTLINENNALREKLEELSEQLAAGMNKPAFEQALVKQPIAYALAGEADCQQDYRNLLDWLRQQSQPFNAQPEALEQDKYQLHEAWLRINAELNGLRERLAASRWPQVRRHVPAAEQIRVQVEQCWQQADQALIRQQALMRNSGLSQLASPTPIEAQALPAPRALSALHPTYMSIAGNDDKPLFMENVRELGKTALLLDSPEAYLSFTLYCSAAHFYRLDLLFGTCLRANPCHLRVIIRAVNSQGHPAEVLRLVWVDGLEVLDNQFFPLRFESLADSAGKTYWIEIDAPDATQHTALALWCHRKQPYIEYAQQNEDFWYWPHALPNAAQKLLLDVPLSPRLHSDKPQHVFLLHMDGVSNDVLGLHVFLLRLAHMLDNAQQAGQVWLCGALSPTVMEYVVNEPALHMCPRLHWVERVQAALVLQQTAWEDAEVLLWNMQLSALPEADLLPQAKRLFAEETQAALLLPQEINAQDTILAAYALPVREGRLLFPAVGEAADAPEHSYRRSVQAAQSHLFILRSTALHEIDWAQVAAYQSCAYQSSDLIQQLQAQGWTSVYQACLRYVRNKYALDNALADDDAERFRQHWGPQLLNALSPLASKAQCIAPTRQTSLLVINDTLPEYDQDAASLRLYTLLKLWCKLDYHISFVADNADVNPRYRRMLEDLGIEVFCGDSNIQQAMAWRDFDIALICRVEVGYRYMPFVRLLSPETRIWYDTVDIHYIREQRQADLEEDVQLAKKALQTKRKELHNCRQSDIVLTVTVEDGLHLQKDLPGQAFQVIPTIHSRPTLPAVPFEQRDGLVFIGNYHHAPNADAVHYFIDSVLPLIVQRFDTLSVAHEPEVKFYILGSHMSDAHAKAWEQDAAGGKNPNVQAVGWVDEVEPAFAQRKIFVSYLRYGAGMKGKIGQAMALGLPVVTTSIGAEGMGLQDGENALIADTPEAFADAVCRLYQDAALWQKLADQGQVYIENHYGETAVLAQLQKLL